MCNDKPELMVRSLILDAIVYNRDPYGWGTPVNPTHFLQTGTNSFKISYQQSESGYAFLCGMTYYFHLSDNSIQTVRGSISPDMIYNCGWGQKALGANFYPTQTGLMNGVFANTSLTFKQGSEDVYHIIAGNGRYQFSGQVTIDVPGDPSIAPVVISFELQAPEGIRMSNHFDTTGKELMKLEHYAQLVHYYGPNVIHPLGLMPGPEYGLYALQTESNKFRLMPGPDFSPLVYRGQTRVYDCLKASIYRDPSEARRVINLIKIQELRELIRKHPTAREMSNWSILDCTFSIDYVGLAQHYELPTEMLDFTRSRDVALFFALFKKYDGSNEYEKIRDDDKKSKPVIYSLDIKEMMKDGHAVNIIGVQPFLRPYYQQALSITTISADKFSDRKYLKCETLTQDQIDDFYDRSEGSERLFPPEVISKKALIIRDSRTVDNDVVKFMFEADLFPVEMKIDSIDSLKELLDRENIELADKGAELSFTEEEELQAKQDWEKIRPSIVAKITYRPVSKNISISGPIINF